MTVIMPVPLKANTSKGTISNAQFSHPALSDVGLETKP